MQNLSTKSCRRILKFLPILIYVTILTYIFFNLRPFPVARFVDCNILKYMHTQLVIFVSTCVVIIHEKELVYIRSNDMFFY